MATYRMFAEAQLSSLVSRMLSPAAHDTKARSDTMDPELNIFWRFAATLGPRVKFEPQRARPESLRSIYAAAGRTSCRIINRV